MKYYHKYKEALEDKGYTVDEHGYVWDSTGNQAAGEDNYGNVQSKDPNVTSICQEAEAAMTATPKPRTKKATKKQEPEHEESLEMVRARDENGHFIADDPSTPDVNEAWVVKTVKKATPPAGKKRARTAKGHYIADNPSIPENEAWVDE